MDWIKNISDSITKIIGSARKPIPSIPPILLLCEIMNRPGLSGIALSAAVIAKLEPKGFDTGVGACGMENMNNKFVRIMAEETIKHIQQYGRADNVVAPMALSFQATGGNAGGPLQVVLSNPSLAEFGGLPR